MKSLELTEIEGRVIALQEESSGKMPFEEIGKTLGFSGGKARQIYKKAVRKTETSRCIENALARGEALEAVQKELLYLVPQFRFALSRFGTMRNVLLVPREELRRRVSWVGWRVVEKIEKVLSQSHYKLRLGMTEAELKERGL